MLQYALLDQLWARLDQQEAMLTVFGRGDSPDWKALLSTSINPLGSMQNTRAVQRKCRTSIHDIVGECLASGQ